MSAVAMAVGSIPLDQWIAGRFGVSEHTLTRSIIAEHQLRAIRESVSFARAHSSFYSRRFASMPPGAPASLDDLSHFPFTTAQDIAEHGSEFLCVPQSDIARVVTLQSSGTTGEPKRIFFTAADQELALDFFAHGVATLAESGDRMLIALPGDREGSVGFQLAKGIARAGVTPIPHGLVVDPLATLRKMERESATSIIGLPVQMLALSLQPLAASVFQRLRSIVLCSDHVPDSIVSALHRMCGADVFQHYGSTEMGLGGGVDCVAHSGYHLREADLYFEIVSPETGESLPDGELGEVVFTTLNRTAMPLIRYRTGDISRFVQGSCECGSVIRRLEKVRNRVDGFVRVGESGLLSISMLDEVLFAVPGIADFSASFAEGVPQELHIVVHVHGTGVPPMDAVRRALMAIPAVRRASTTSDLQLHIMHTHAPVPGTAGKRKIAVHEA